MGLNLEVGILADLKNNDQEGYEHFTSQFAVVNQYLMSLGLPPHHEPESCQVWSCDMFGYLGLHYLRRIAAHLDQNSELVSPGDEENTDNDEALDRYYSLLGNGGYDHLIQHSDAEGYYLPVEFRDVLYPDESLGIAGGMIGSSVRLLAECQRIATRLGIPEHLTESSEELQEAAAKQGEGSELWERYGIESYSCVCLMEGCRRSMAERAALVFG